MNDVNFTPVFIPEEGQGGDRTAKSETRWAHQRLAGFWSAAARSSAEEEGSLLEDRCKELTLEEGFYGSKGRDGSLPVDVGCIFLGYSQNPSILE